MGTIIPLINLTNDIPLKIFWIPGYYQPFFEFTVDPRQHPLVIDTCFLFAKRIKGRNSSYSVAGKLNNSLLSEHWDDFKHVFSKNDQIESRI